MCTILRMSNSVQRSGHPQSSKTTVAAVNRSRPNSNMHSPFSSFQDPSHRRYTCTTLADNSVALTESKSLLSTLCIISITYDHYDDTIINTFSDLPVYIFKSCRRGFQAFAMLPPFLLHFQYSVRQHRLIDVSFLFHGGWAEFSLLPPDRKNHPRG